MEYIFNTQKLKKLDLDGYTYYSRRLNGELGRRYMRLYIALRRLANTYQDFITPITALAPFRGFL